MEASWSYMASVSGRGWVGSQRGVPSPSSRLQACSVSENHKWMFNACCFRALSEQRQLSLGPWTGALAFLSSVGG